MHRPTTYDDAFLAKRLDDICEGFRIAIDREVEMLRREGLPIYVCQDGKIVDLNAKKSESD